MKRVKSLQKAGALLLALVLCLGLSVPALAAETQTTLETASQEAATAAATYGSAAHISWAVWQDGQILTSGSLSMPGAADGGQPEQSDPGSLYGVGSVSKIYTTVAVMQLAEAGKLELDKPGTAYLPDFKMADERYREITVRMLLNHSSGLMGSSMGSGVLFGDASSTATDQLLQRLANQRLKADPGAYSVYCNDGFTLAELVVEAVSGQDFMDYIRANVLEPAGLKNTHAPGDSFSGRANIYQGEDPRPLPMDCLGVVGAGGIYATAEDLAAFGGALTDTTLLTHPSLDAMAAPEYARGIWPESGTDALSFGLGWDSVEWYPLQQNGITALVKGGDTLYYHAGLVVIPEHRLAAAVLTSGGMSTYNELAATRMLIAALAAKGVEVDEEPLTLPAAKAASMPRAQLANAGFYGGAYPYKIDITATGKLTMHYVGLDLPEQTFTYCSDGTFRDASGTASLSFVKEDNGQTYLYQQAFSQIPGLGGLPVANYAAMKLPENEIDPALQAVWSDFMSGTSLLPMNERYSSQIYLSISAAMAAEAAETETETEAENIPGYVGVLRIVDETRVQYAVQVPGNAGRDGYDLELRKDAQGRQWVYQSNGMVFMEEAAVPSLSAGSSAVCTIQPDGYARWYHIGDDAAGKTMAVKLPENAGFWVYGDNGEVLASSVLWEDTSLTLPEGGLVVFAGDPGAKFQLTFS